jgi:hypothetical protein
MGLRWAVTRMSNQPKDTPMSTETDEADAPLEPPDAEPDYDEGVPEEPDGTSTSDLPEGATDGELPPAP